MSTDIHVQSPTVVTQGLGTEKWTGTVVYQVDVEMGFIRLPAAQTITLQFEWTRRWVLGFLWCATSITYPGDYPRSGDRTKVEEAIHAKLRTVRGKKARRLARIRLAARIAAAIVLPIVAYIAYGLLIALMA